METYISILRGINVSGKNMIKMDALKKIYETLNFQKVTTYVQSGNIVFSSPAAHSRKLESIIHARILHDLGLDVPVIVMTREILRRIIDNNPYSHYSEKEYLHVTFLADSIQSYNMEALENRKYGNEEIAVGDRAVYLFCPNGYGKTKLNNTFLENNLKVTATTRNWKTTLELSRIAESIEAV